nr:pumilio homolog 11-like [Setaria viridis]
MTRVLHILAASSPDQIVAVARNHAGSNILQTLMGRMAGNPGHAELFTSTLARVGEHGVVSLMEHSDGCRLIITCLDTFSIYQNRFITAVVASSFFLRRLCRDKHGCTVVNRCIDKAAGDDEQLSRSIVLAMRSDGIALAEHGFHIRTLFDSLISGRDRRRRCRRRFAFWVWQELRGAAGDEVGAGGEGLAARAVPAGGGT